jgi:erythritol kinase
MITGTGINPSNQSAHLIWLREHRPDLLERAATAFHCKDWLYFKACGEIATDPAEAVFTFGNFRTLAYDDRVLELLGLGAFRRLLPPIVDGCRHHGRLLADAASATALLPGTPVVLAPLDVPCTVLGAGGYAPGRRVGCSILGSTGMHSRMFTALAEVEPLHEAGYVMPFPVAGVRAGMMSHMAATLNIDWLLQLVAQAQALGGRMPSPPAELLAQLEPRIAAARPGAALFHPFIADNGERGPFVEPAARAQLSGLSTGVGLDQIARAVYEGIAFAARDCYEALGALPDEVRVTGGAAKSGAMRSMLASALDRPVRVSRRDEAGAAGAAIVAAVSIGGYHDVDEALPRWVDARLAPEPIAPEPPLVRDYAALFPIYRAGYRSMPQTWRALDDFRKAH